MDILALREAAPDAAPHRALWGRQGCLMPTGSSAYHLIPPRLKLTRDSFVKAVKKHGELFRKNGVVRVYAKRKLPIPKNFTKLGPPRKVQMLMKSRVTPHHLNRFIDDHVHANLSKQARGSLLGFRRHFVDTRPSVT